MTTGEQFFPLFSGRQQDRVLNLLVNANPVTFGIRAFFLAFPDLARKIGPAADALLAAQRLPNNLFDSARTPVRPFQVGDRVSSPFRQWPGSADFGGYILVINDEWAVVQWDFIPVGPLTYDPLMWLEPQILD